ncbi:TetR/AcrR family transcriptional regulator [Pseudoglutamicibacter cumminsii]|uniref:TetR/AcrR family transcriptional regulator n=1 Tax=Pseudoglutamicibacter cumminsii TaxID=156979 RepID=A0AAP4C769_9MICC|nr:TetR/AcrR family transcriptional regulator [Pseudoglutamicibacter cumminsii]MBM7795712.1 AcrR family transcriptional regulator [Pseudoglutamicibacter cumminsii]MDK6274750.1 TetR/AcrR family transcriptional regulator [Pseudoglutamicibacter cumminsii]
MPRSRNETRQATRRAVLKATSRLFGERGFASTTIREIAQEAGVSVGTVMAAGDKEALLVELFDDLIDQRQQHIDSLDLDTSEPCGDSAISIVEPFVALFEERRELARTYASVLVRGRHTSVVFTDLARRLIDVFEQLITAHGCTSRADTHRRAEALHSAYIGNLFIWASTTEQSGADLLTQLRKVFTAICPPTGSNS